MNWGSTNRRYLEFDELGFDELGFDELGFDELGFNKWRLHQIYLPTTLEFTTTTPAFYVVGYLEHFSL
jgi:hypothetical protein